MAEAMNLLSSPKLRFNSNLSHLSHYLVPQRLSSAVRHLTLNCEKAMVKQATAELAKKARGGGRLKRMVGELRIEV